MVLYRRFLFILTVSVLVAASCTKPVLIGSDFLQDEKASLKFKDDFDLTFYTEKTDSVIVHSDNVSRQLFTYLLGNVDEPIFGHYSAEIFAQPILPSTAQILQGATVDSVVLQLRYDTSGTYGSILDPVTVEVYRMTENPEFNTEYDSDHKFSTGELLGSLIFVPKPYDSITVVRDTNEIDLPPSIRIPLSTSILGALTTQSSGTFTHQDTFLQFLNGLHIRMIGANNTMLGFNLLNSGSKLIYYFNNVGAIDQEFSFVFTTASIKTVYMEHDYTGSFAESSLLPEPETDYWFVQGMSGLTTHMTIGGLDALGNVIINQAELEVYCSFPNGDVPELYPPIPYMVTQEMTDTSIVNSIDVLVALSRTTGNYTSEGYKALYGGVLEKVADGPPAVYRYKMKVTAQVIDIYKEKKENSIYFNPFDKANVPNRSVMFGPGHPEFAPRLRIYYTAL